MSRLDEIKARYGWCERCANHDPRDRRDHRHLRSQTEIDALWLVDQVERLERWKVEACEVMSGLRELGKALGLGLGVQITGPAALAEVARLTAECDALAAQVARVEALVEEWEGDDSCDNRTCVPHRSASALRAALAGSETDTSEQETEHRCEPCYSRSECGQCGWQEQWCATCSRQMCGCATKTTGQEDQS